MLINSKHNIFKNFLIIIEKYINKLLRLLLHFLILLCEEMIFPQPSEKNYAFIPLW